MLQKHPQARIRPLFLAVLAAAALTGAGAAAQTLKGLTLSVEGFQHHYSEPDTIEVNSDKPFLGARAEYTQGFYRGWFLRLHGRYARGEADWEVDGFGSAGGVDQTFWEGAVEWGRDIGFEGTLAIAPFIGFGFRRWQDEAGGARTTGGAFGFDRQVDYYYVPVGVTAFWVLGDAWTMSLRGEYRFLVHGREKGQFSDIPGVSFDLDNAFEDGRGAAAELLVRKKFADSLTVAFGPFIRYWNFEESEVDADIPLVVPENETVEAGIVFKINIGPPL